MTLEWIVIWLIVVEIVIEVVSIVGQVSGLWRWEDEGIKI